MTTTPQAALLREAAQNALTTLDGIANANPRDKTDFDTPDEWIAWAKSRARWAADALREPVAQEVYAERILRQMLHESDQTQSMQVEPALTEEEIWFIASDGMRSAAGGIYQSSVIEFARAVEQAVIAKLQATQEPVQAEPALRDYANSLIKAGHDFWKACNREAGGGAVRWLSCDDGTLIVFTRGEYRDTIMENIGCYKAPEVFFEEDGITAAESKEPVQAGELPDEREAFEDWAWKRLQLNTERCEPPEDGFYMWQSTMDAWMAWQAATERAALSARKPLTDERAAQIASDATGWITPQPSHIELVRAVERAHGIGLEVKP